MKFDITISGNISREQSKMITDLSLNIQDALKGKSYGTSIETFLIGFICVAPQFDSFFKAGKPRYTSGSKTGVAFVSRVTVTNQFEYNIKMDFEYFVKSTIEKGRELLITEIENSLANFDAYKKKFKDFDLDSFKKDFLDILKSLRSTLDDAKQDNNAKPITTLEKSIPMTNVDSALNQFEQYSVKHVATIGTAVPGDSYQKLLQAVDYLKAHDAIRELEKFKNHRENAVQLMAASFLLPSKPKVAIEMLSRISKLDSKESFIAKMLMQDLKDGSI